MPGVKSYTRPARNSNVSPLRGGANAPLILLTAIFLERHQPTAQSKPLRLRLVKVGCLCTVDSKGGRAANSGCRGSPGKQSSRNHYLCKSSGGVERNSRKRTMFVELRDCHLDDEARASESHLAQCFDTSASVLCYHEHQHGKWKSGGFLFKQKPNAA